MARVDMSGEDAGPRTGLKIGHILEQAREARGISLPQAEQATKIRARYLKELERENFDILPPVYVVGSLRTYADYLGLDTESLVRELKYRQTLGGEFRVGSVATSPGLAGEPHKTPEENEFTLPSSSSGIDGRLYLGAAALLVLVLALVAFTSSRITTDEQLVSQVREPLALQVPGGGGEGILLRAERDVRSAVEDSDDSSREQGGNSSDGNLKNAEQSGEGRDEPDPAQDPYAESTASPSPTAEPVPAATQQTVTPTSSASPTATAPTSAPTEPAATEPAVSAAEPPAGSARAEPRPRRLVAVGPRPPSVRAVTGRQMTLVRPPVPVARR